MFKTLGRSFFQFLGGPLRRLSPQAFSDRHRRRLGWLHFRRAMSVWFGTQYSSVWLHCDHPAIYDGSPIEVSGPVMFIGWALATRGIASVLILCDGEQIGEAAYGIGRPDVTSLSSHLRQSVRCGFQYVLDPRQIATGLHKLTIQAVSYDGATARNQVMIDVTYSAADYACWLKKTAATPATLEWMRRNLPYLPEQPTVSLFLAVNDKTSPEQLAATVRSMEEQAYPHWQLCLACDKAVFESIGEQVSHLCDGQSRITLHVEPFEDRLFFPVEKAHGDFLGLIDPGDVLQPSALFEAVYFLNRHADVDLVYTDEDVLVDFNLRDHPRFKPDWSPAMLQHDGGVGRLWLAGRDLVVAAGGLSQIVEAGGEQRLLTKMTSCARQVGHLPSIVYTRGQAHAPATRVDRGQKDKWMLKLQEPTILVPAPHPLMEHGQVRRILLVMLDHLGDVLLTFPAVDKLRALFPEARISALVGSWSEPLARSNPSIDEVLTYDFFVASSSEPEQELEEEEEQRLEKWLSALQFDLAVDFRREPETRDFLHWSRARYTVGFANGKAFEWLTLAVPYEPNIQRHQPRRHVTQDLLHLVDMIELAGRSDIVPQMKTTPEAQAEIESLLKPMLAGEDRLLVAIHPGSGRAIKCWPGEYFASLADRLIEQLNAMVLFLGAPGEVGLVQAICEQMNPRERASSLAGRLTITQLVAALQKFDLFIGNDSGPTHMAAALGLPTLCVCSGTIHPSQWAPVGPAALAIQRQMLCSPCYLRDQEECPFGVACLQELPVEAVWEATLRVLLPKWYKLRDRSAVFSSARDPKIAAERPLAEHRGEALSSPVPGSTQI
jgi:ADP-heptose:LPS heptosyltransferase